MPRTGRTIAPYILQRTLQNKTSKETEIKLFSDGNSPLKIKCNNKKVPMRDRIRNEDISNRTYYQ